MKIGKGKKRVEEIVNTETTVTSRKYSESSPSTRGFSQSGFPHKIFICLFIVLMIVPPRI